MRPLGRCPGCDAAEGMYHANGCTVAPIGTRPCCYTPVFAEHHVEHVSNCPAGWGTQPVPEWQFPDLGRDPWRGIKWATSLA